MNERLFEIIFYLANKNVVIDAFGIFLAVYAPYLMLVGFLALLFWEKDMRRRAFFFAEVALSGILARGLVVEAIRYFYINPRPFEALNIQALVEDSGSSSFPSGHMSFYFAIAMIVFFINRNWGKWYFIIVSVIGLARIFTGIHWPLDIVGGAVAGLLSGYLVHLVLKKYLPKISTREEVVIEETTIITSP